MMEDSFEKARRTFFGAAGTSPEMSASSADFFKPRNEIPPQEITSPSSDQHEVALPLALSLHEKGDLNF